MRCDVLVVGGGPAGMMAAITAANNKKKVVLVEKNARLGRKLLITGKGRCNITNNCSVNELINNVVSNPRFMYSAFTQFDADSTISFFEGKGLLTKTERGNRVFPISDKAVDVVDCLVGEIKKSGVFVREGTVKEVLTSENTVIGVKLSSGEEITSSKVIIATGGLSYPLTGSTGDGYKLAKSVNHTVTEIKPSLVALLCKDENCTDLQGLSLKNVTVKLFDKKLDKVIYEELGEMIFTHFGMSGPLILSASAHIKTYEKGRYEIQIDLKPGLSPEKLDERILRDFTKFINKDLTNSLYELLPKKIISVIIYILDLSPVTKIHQITKEHRKKLVSIIKGLTFSVDGFAPIDEAIITAGGVNVKEINPKTMESKIVSGLYFAGELLDVDAYTGGFNLQVAFSTGVVAGSNASLD